MGEKEIILHAGMLPEGSFSLIALVIVIIVT